jgi:hypothetical protein
LWDLEEWEIRFDVEVAVYHSKIPCPHCGPIQSHDHKRWDGSVFVENVTICPRVIVAYNEAGYCTTGLCADCVEAVLKSLKEPK